MVESLPEFFEMTVMHERSEVISAIVDYINRMTLSPIADLRLRAVTMNGHPAIEATFKMHYTSTLAVWQWVGMPELVKQRTIRTVIARAVAEWCRENVRFPE